MVPKKDAPATPGRRRGRPPRIDRTQIVAAARAIAPEDLTMQAVADALGVDRTSLHHHVGDRDGLLELVVADLFEAEMSQLELPPGGGWPDILRAYGCALHTGILKLRVSGTHFRLRGTRNLELTERVLASLTSAGFDVEDAGRILTLVSGIALSSAHDLLGGDRSRQHQVPEMERALHQIPTGELPLLKELVASRGQEDAAAQDFDFSLGVVITGLRQRLSSA